MRHADVDALLCAAAWPDYMNSISGLLANNVITELLPTSG